MRKIKTIFTALLLCVLTAFAAGCAKNDDFNTTRDVTDPEFAESVSMTTEFPEYDGNISDIKVTFTNNGDKDFSFGDQDFDLQKETGESWRYLNTSGSITAMACVIKSGSTQSYTFHIGDYVKTPLSAGTYRLIVGEGKCVCAEFKVK